MKSLSLMLCVVAGLLAAPSFAAKAPDVSEMMKHVIEVPGTELWAVEKNGKVIFMTKNKRFAIVGKIVDTFERREIVTMDDVRAARRLNFKRVGMDWNELTTLTIGKGEKEIVIFTDPFCVHCKEMLRQAVPLADRYTIRVVLFPILKPQSRLISGQLYCSGDPRAAIDRLLNSDFEGLSGVSTDCASAKLMNTAFTGLTFNVHAVPFIFAPNGEPNMGRVNNLRAFVEENAS